MNIGSNFDELLTEAGILDETTEIAVNRVISWQLSQEMNAQNHSKTTILTEAAD
jgi:hypothetical protein